MWTSSDGACALSVGATDSVRGATDSGQSALPMLGVRQCALSPFARQRSFPLLHVSALADEYFVALAQVTFDGAASFDYQAHDPRRSAGTADETTDERR